jgi:16S rRNA pseudouridine516 synthase
MREMKMKKQRLDKILVHMGIGSRKEIRKLAKAGLITVNEEVVTDSSIHVDPEQDRIEVDGEPIIYREFIYLMMNKPAGYVSATEDARERVVLELLDPEYLVFQPFPAGRLDKDTEGFLLLTNDGQLAHQLLSPKKKVPKTYYAKIKGLVTDGDVLMFRQGVVLDDGYVTLPAELAILHSGEISEVEIVIYEGKYHQIKRMFQAIGKEVIYLKRTAIGKLQLDPQLALGEYREITAEELDLLRQK